MNPRASASGGKCRCRACYRRREDGDHSYGRDRSQLAEFPNAWLKERLGLRRFRLKGKTKAAIESLWAVITCNLQQGIRLGVLSHAAGTQV